MKVFAASTDSQLDDNVNTATVSKHLLLDDMDGSLGRNALFSHRSGASMVSGSILLLICMNVCIYVCELTIGSNQFI